MLAVLACVLAAAPAHAANPLVAQWHLDTGHTGSDEVTSTPDSSGNMIDAGVRYATQAVGRFGNATSFTPATVVATESPLLRPTSFTVMAWVYATQSPGTARYIIAQGAGPGCVPAAYAMYTSTAPSVNAGGVEFYVTHNGQTYAAGGVPPASIWNGQWHNVTGTFDGARARFYFDGDLIGSGIQVPGAVSYTNQVQTFAMGNYGGFTDVCAPVETSFVGRMDEVRVYNRNLTDREVQQIADFGGSDPPVLVQEPIVHTTGVDQITASSARVSGTINNRGDAVLYRVQYGKTTNYGSFGPTLGLAGSEATQNVSSTITGLDPDSDYHARLVSGDGVGEDVTFHTSGTPVVRFMGSSFSVNEASPVAEVRVERAGGINGTATVNWATSNGTAQTGSDFPGSSGTVTFSPGETVETVQIPITNDADDEPDETFGVALSSPSAGTNLGTPSAATVTILDDDLPKQVRFSATAFTVGESGTGGVTVERTGATGQTASVELATSDGTAQAGADYTATVTTVSFAVGEASKNVTVPVLPDTANEPDETVTVTLSNPSAGTPLGTPGVTTLTIVDDDEPPDLTPPVTTIALDPAEPNSFGFYTGLVTVTVSAVGASQTRCLIDPPEAPASFDALPAGACAPFQLAGLGEHTIYAASRDAAGNTEAIVKRTFRIDEFPDTTITDGPGSETWRPDNLFRFTSSTPGARFECGIDDGPWSPCSSPHGTGTLSQGFHTFRVRAVTPGGTPDFTPATQTFTVLGPSTDRYSCEVRRVGWIPLTLQFTPQPERYACQIGRLPRAGCPTGNVCTATPETCPYGARCTLTTRVAFFTADLGVNWGMGAIADTREISELGPSVGDTVRRPPAASSICLTQGRDRCSTSTTTTRVGENQPLWAGCTATLVFGAASMSGTTVFRNPDVRRIECDAEWRIEPIPELAAVPDGEYVQVSVALAGLLVIDPFLLGGSTAQAAAAKPKISRIRTQVTGPGAATAKLKLNAAAKRLLKRRRKLSVRLDITFTPTGGKPVKTTQRVTIRQPKAQPKICKVSRTARRLPRCAR